MNPKDKISDKFKALLSDGQRILASAGWDGSEYHGRHPNGIEYFRFRTEALNIIKRACGESSDHYRELRRIAESGNSASNSYFLKDCFGVLQAASNDFEHGLLFDLRALVTAEVLEDFIDQAESLLAAGYFVPAASLVGAILEDALRKLCAIHNIALPGKSGIDRLNSELARKEVYSKLVQKRITALADIRNNADHGHFDRFGREDVEDMISWVRRFTADQLG